MNLELQEIYDNFAEDYEKNRNLFDMTEVLAAFYESFKLEKGSLLDLGCGAGEPFAREFINKGWKVTGVDFSIKMLEMAAKFVPKMKTIHSDIRKVDFDENQFNAITAIYSLFHIPCEEHIYLFKKFYNWLNPNGMVLFTYATKEYTGFDQFNGFKNFVGQELFYSHKTPEKLYLDLQSVGFNIVSTDYRNIGGETFLWVTVNK